SARLVSKTPPELMGRYAVVRHSPCRFRMPDCRSEMTPATRRRDGGALTMFRLKRHGFGTSTMPRPSAYHRCRSGAGSAPQVARFGPHRMTDDLVDVFYRPLVQPLGNLVILCAQAEASLLDLVAAMQGSDERQAQSVLKREDAKDQILALVRDRSVQGFEIVGAVGCNWQLLVRPSATE